MPHIAPPTFAVLASGAGTNFEALMHASRSAAFPGRIELLVCDRQDALVIERAQRLAVPAITPAVGRFRTRIEDEGAWVAALRERGVNAVLLAGFMRRLHATFLDAFPSRVLNVHPSLLPAYAGLSSIRRALDDRVGITGCTVHVVTDDIDAGPIVAQSTVAIRDDDTLETLTARVHDAEHALYPVAVRRYFGEPHRIEGGRVTFGAATGVAT